MGRIKLPMKYFEFINKEKRTIHLTIEDGGYRWHESYIDLFGNVYFQTLFFITQRQFDEIKSQFNVKSKFLITKATKAQ